MSNGIEYFVGDDKQHYFRVKAQNGKVVALSEGYKTLASAEKGAAAMAKAVTFITDEPVQEAIAEVYETTPETLDAFADIYGHLLHPTAVPSSAYVIAADRQTLRDLLEVAAEAGWAIIPPAAAEDAEGE